MRKRWVMWLHYLEDTDTVGAAAGGVAGLRYGMDKIPENWLAVIAKRELIEGLCTSFSEKFCIAAKE